MIPKEQKDPVMSAMGDFSGPVLASVGDSGIFTQPIPSLDLGKKLSVPQDLMMEELSLRNNRGSLLFQKRQRRVQRFTFELSARQREIVAGSAKGKMTRTGEPGTIGEQAVNGPGAQENYRSELHVYPAASGVPGDARSPVPTAERARTPSALAPGYAEPLKGIPPEKFNHTAIPKGYRCPWQEFVSYQDYQGDGRSHTPNPAEYRNFNKTPVPFGGPLFGEIIPRAATPFALEPLSGLELLRRRPSFNRVAQGWVRHLPESEEL
ncbi:PREDICTED: myozenin-3 [Elephantulus edwardii]|uniref:myozenin-3 n=1 Tax=Elephantulus edwardii TaxID=28737 RepID=UPI0003F07EE0|nr:PREDICTED: myozenin-3 [Elephantulus edwardii]